MAYDAITIDTQTIYGNNNELKSGIVGQLYQYKDGQVRFILSEIVLREILKLRTNIAQGVLDKQKTALRDGGKSGLLNEAAQEAIKEIVDKLPTADDHARTELKAFMADCGGEVVPAKLALTEDVIKAYFRGDPPFSAKGKKNEFPDSIALLSLEAWAKENKKRILAVSRDGDWESFGNISQRIDVVKDLGDAMASLTKHAEAVLPHAVALVAEIRSEPLGKTFTAFGNQLEYAVSDINPYVDFDGPMLGEAEESYVTLADYELLPDGDEADIEIIRIGHESFVARVPVSIDAKITTHIQFAIYDSIDKDYVPMGSTEVETEETFSASVLIHVHAFEVEEDGVVETVWEIDNVELTDAPSDFDIGYVDYSLADEYDAEDWMQNEDEPEPAPIADQSDAAPDA